MAGPRILTDEQVDEACDLREQGWSCQRISNHFASGGVRVSAGSISWQCLRQGADLPPSRRRQQHGMLPGRSYQRGNHVIRTFSQDDDAKLLELDIAGLRIADIARALDRKPNSIRGRLATLARHQARQEDFS